MNLRHTLLTLLAALGLVCAGVLADAGPAAAAALPNTVVPAPVSEVSNGSTFTLTSTATLTSDDTGVGGYLAGILRASTGYALPLTVGAAGPGSIALELTGAPASVGPEGYQLTSTATGVVIQAQQPAGLFHGVQTLLQLLPPAVMSTTTQPGPWTVPGGTVLDYPRFAYRGAMLDVARHFFTVAQVEHYIDELALYKVNYLHLHLSDDQGWRIAVNSWPNLATYGGSTEVGGGQGGFYTQADYSAIVAYAASRYMTVVPEIDMPGHTNAALASYAQLNCNGVAPALYTGTNVGFSSLCTSLPLTYTFVDQVVGELAALTPGPYLHIGGDEASSTPVSDYTSFVDQAQQIVAAHGKSVVGWHDITKASLLPSAVAQFWGTTTTDSNVANAAASGTKVIMSPANKAYLDMKYTRKTKLGQTWAGLIEVNTAYGWDPGNYLTGVTGSSVMGVEGPLWTETIVTSADIDTMAFPRLPALAELGWSPWSTHNVTDFDQRLGAQGPRWKTMGIAYYHSTQVSWPAGS
ncbi:beta-N-acetylhexosaminidase [Actinacidiphila acididurans]|uniref:beta-N-acetylhexosaminidase n=1 Tax=Actinacidiphila acididurans TaxID=2784346 RepID=A0ABS2TM51_9ACTN|nr:beta-N-acetylhexosaminidase [Actinacidiphila acididurans]MBM9504423.1 beta-N-acetylhexosaminidase [Actinacidiphila acididurans]